MHRTVAPSGYEILYQFRAKSGAQPHARLINVNGTLYGTTSAADAYHGGLRGCGTVFALTP